MSFGGIRNPNRSDFNYLKDSRGELNTPTLVLTLILFYFIFFWITYAGTKVLGTSPETGTWIARGVSGFLTAWAALGNLRGRFYLGIIVFPATAYGIYYLTTLFAR